MRSARDASYRIIDYYSYLFTFPTRRVMTLIMVGTSTIGGAFAFTIALGRVYFLQGLLYGFVGLFVPLFVSDAISSILFKTEDFLNPRRFTSLSYASCIIHTSIALLSSLGAYLLKDATLLARGIFFAISVNAFLRHLVVFVFSTQSILRTLTAIFFPPFLCWSTASFLIPIFDKHLPLLALLSVAIVASGSQLLLWVMRNFRSPYKKVEIMPLFRAFILAWADGVNGPLETQISQIGEQRELYVDSLVFRDHDDICRAVLINPYIHPGPFRNVGSSALTKIFVDNLSSSLGCEVLISHGVSTHEQDLTRISDSERAVEAVKSDLKGGVAVNLSTPVIWAEKEGAKASCQVFGDTALITLTLSPQSYDDLPLELGERIMEAALTMDLKAVVVDSHNSIRLEEGLTPIEGDYLYEAAVESMKNAKAAQKQEFSIGSARVTPREWGLNEGMGPCGVAALIVRLLDGQAVGYVIIDGNNMTSGLRERIIETLQRQGFEEIEVLTSDTHLVNAIGATTSGYHPIGERIEEEKLVTYIEEALKTAQSQLVRCTCTHRRTTIRGLTVLGESGLTLLSDVLESAFNLFKRTTLAVAPTTLLLSALLIYLL